VDRAVCEGAVQVIDETLDTLAERIYLGLVGLQLVLCSVDQHLVIRLHLVIQKRHLVHGHETLIFVQHQLHHAGLLVLQGVHAVADRELGHLASPLPLGAPARLLPRAAPRSSACYAASAPTWDSTGGPGSALRSRATRRTHLMPR